MEKGQWIAPALLAAGIVISGWFIGHGFMKARTAERFVTMKGVAEREVQANIALWPLRFVATNDNLAEAQNKIKRSSTAVYAFLKEHGIDSASTEVQKTEVTDVLANQYRSGTTESRYIIAKTIMVRTNEVGKVVRASQSVGMLVDAGVILSSVGGPESGPTYLFTDLNKLKPEMIAEATASARKGAEQFARDSGSKLGGIRTASQGVFEILPRDRTPGIFEGSQLNKTLRVVTTVEYMLED
ncbi:MAG TPA: SIMPL domain-containing protein [Bacteroidota bacterium]|nr:SIMPL domain-containing protein [Bacteroidota bacterium]